MGCGMDLLIKANSARKHIGNRFEELMRCDFTELGIRNKRTVIKIPYESENNNTYKCENDLILTLNPDSDFSTTSIDEDDVVVSIKTTSKDRMGKIFIDKLLLQEFIGHELKVIGIFLNDVQRKNDDNIAHTLVSNLFMVYTTFLTELDGVYYVEPPPIVSKAPYN